MGIYNMICRRTIRSPSNTHRKKDIFLKKKNKIFFNICCTVSHSSFANESLVHKGAKIQQFWLFRDYEDRCHRQFPVHYIRSSSKHSIEYSCITNSQALQSQLLRQKNNYISEDIEMSIVKGRQYIDFSPLPFLW